MMNCKVLFLFIAIFFVHHLSGQSTSFLHFTPNTEFEKKTLESIVTRFQKDLQNIQGTNKKYIAEIYKERLDLIKERFAGNEVLTDEKVQAYLNNLAEEIFKNNKQLKRDDLRILFSRTYIPNATSMGEGTVFFNIGLFHRLQNESQAAFVICHEIAHYFLNHTNNAIDRYVNTIYSDEFQKTLKKIQKTEFGRNKEAEQLTKNLMFKNRRHSREFEQSADSMALELMKNTAYDVKEALSCLALLDSVDHDKYHLGLQLEKQLNFIAYPFKKTWLENDDLKFIFSNKDVRIKEEDSLKTHPDCRLRIEKLKEKTNNYFNTASTINPIDEKEFLNLKAAFDYEIINYAFQANRISKALFLALEMYGFFPDDVKVQTAIGKSLNKIFTNQKAHTLGKIVDLPSPDLEPSYNNFLHFIQNLRLSEVGALSYYFLTQNQNIFSSNEEFVKALIQSKINFEKHDEKQKWIDHYRKHFANSNINF